MTSVQSKTSSSNEPNSMFYIMATAGVVGLMGGLYYLWSVLAEEELDEQELIEIEEIKQEVEQNKGQLTKDSAIHILYLTNHHAELELKRLKPDIEARRRAAFNNEFEYKKICGEYLEAKETAYVSSSNKILAQFNSTMEDLNKLIVDVDPMDLEKKNVCL